MRGLILLSIIGALAACDGAGQSRAHRAQALIATHCAACHRVPGIALATGRVGPSLAHIGSQQIIAGFFPNNPQMLTEWVEHPQKLLPGNAMPEMGLSREDAATIVDYLYTME
jgi:cytochrome c